MIAVFARFGCFFLFALVLRVMFVSVFKTVLMCVCVRATRRELEVTSVGWSRATRHPLVHPLSLLFPDL